MEDDIFRDYCKAENSDDEEANRDIQSQLYAKIYYAPNNIENVDIKPNIKFETPSTDNEEFCNKANSGETCGDNAEKEVRRNYENNCVTSDPALAEEDNKSNVNSACIGSQIEISDKNRKNNLNVLYTLQHPQGNVTITQDSKGSTSRREEIINHSNSSSTSRDVCIEPGVEKESQVELNTTHFNFEINESATQSDSKSGNSCVNSEGENIQEKLCIIRRNVNYDVNHDSVLKRYDFSKLFINELYQEKYENLQKELQKLEEEKEMRLRENKQKEEIKEKDKRSQQSDTNTNSISETEADSKYNVHRKNEKQLKASDYFEDEILLLSSDTESDSEESILEVPIPPKPQPPVIHLQDSEDSDALSNNDSDECSFIVEGKINKRVSSRTSLRKTNSSNDELVNSVTEDIVLNCSGVQKAASSIREIKEMSKNIENKSGECNDKNKNDSEKNKSTLTSKISNKNLNDTGKSLSSSEKDNIPEFRVPAAPSGNSNVVFERDKKKSVTSMEDVTNFEISNQPSSSRKRHRENDSECSVNAKQKKHSYRKDTPSEVCTDQHGDKDKTETLWEDYFFRPMSEKLKVFYNESRGQENFNVQDIQSKMSKDPRLWAILDDDLMPNLAKKKRFWNVRCNNCNEIGHQAYNCSLPRKPPRCYMCGTQGHTETRCPQKMCLTCGKRQGTFRKTCEFCRTLYCDMCKAIGHKSTECPDHWRRFHQTTQNSEIHIPENLSEVMKPADLLYCCNCTRRGHDSSTCHDYRWSQHFPTPAFVTNYMGEQPQYEKRRNIASEDVIPLKDKNKQGKHRNLVILEGLGDIQCSSILYRYGSFRTLKHNGQIWDRELEGDLYFKSDNFLKNDFPPSFLNELIKVVPFDLIIYRTDNKALFVRIRTFNGIAVYIYHIFIYWLKLNNEDRRLLNVYINIPRDDKKLLNIFYAKWEEILKTSDDPRILNEQIQSLKSSLTEISDPSILHTTTDRILRLRKKLLNLYNSVTGGWTDKLRQITKAVRKSARKSKGINDRVYLRSIYIYNEIYLPRTLTRQELHELFTRHYVKSKKTDNVKSKKQQKKLDPYAQFLQSLRQNNFTAPQKKEEKRNLKNSSTTSPNIIQEQSKKISASTENTIQEQIKKLPTCPTTKNVTTEQGKKTPTYASTANFAEAKMKKTAACTSSKNVIQEHGNEMPACTIIKTVSTTRNVECNDNVVRTNIDVRSERCYIGEHSNTISESNAVYPIETVITTSLRNNDASTDNEMENTINQIQEKIPKPNVTGIPMIDTTSHQPGNNQIKRTLDLKQNNDNDSEKNIATVKNNNAPATSSLEQKDTVNLEISATKKKKKKKRKTSESSTDVAKNEVASTDLSVENKAQKVINEALKFSLPYMNKAVEEVKKRINDKNIKQEHIDVLQRLINLEKDHQQYVSSFCSYLK